MKKSHRILDPRPVAASAPYTFFMPEPELLEIIAEGDLVKAMFQAIPESAKYHAERMWVRVTTAEESGIEGILDSQPEDMPQLPHGSSIRLQRYQIINVLLNNPDRYKPSQPPPRDYWERCLVDQKVLDGELEVDYIYRVEPDIIEEGDNYPDSGWRIRGDLRGISDEELESREVSYVALGAVLNQDDSWLHLIDEPVGSAFIKNLETDEFEECEEE